jgi:7,8-dihydroneopterin aldolase/epimerase/oxygenase
LRETIDYYAVSRRLLAFGEGRSWKLIETLAVDIAAMVLADFGAEAVTVEVKKFIIPEARHVSVRLTRER